MRTTPKMFFSRFLFHLPLKEREAQHSSLGGLFFHFFFFSFLFFFLLREVELRDLCFNFGGRSL